MSGLTREEVVRMAREIFGQSAVLPVPELDRFAAMAYAAGQAAEREACAGICDRFSEREMHPAECASAIRARG